VHGGLLLFDNRKMSKSLGNFEPLSHLLERHDPQAIRLSFLQTGYSKVMNFTEESVHAAEAVLQRLKRTYRELHARADVPGGSEPGLMTKIEAALDDDMNTSVALAEVLGHKNATLWEFAAALDILGLTPNESWLEEPVRALPADFLDRLRRELDGVVQVNGATPEEAIARVIDARKQARANKDWATSDRLRDSLARSGVALKDSKDGTTWTVAE
jgi:cysteinyl-tRNA synthetase